MPRQHRGRQRPALQPTAPPARSHRGVAGLKIIYPTDAGMRRSLGDGARQAAALGGRRKRHAGRDEHRRAQGAIFATGDWDIAVIGIGVTSPAQLMPFLSGPTPPNGTNFSRSTTPSTGRPSRGEPARRRGGLQVLARGRAGAVAAGRHRPLDARSRSPIYGNDASFALTRRRRADEPEADACDVTAAPLPACRRRWWADHARSAYAVRRTARLLVSMALLLTATFLMIHLVPGDPVRAALGPTRPRELVEAAAGRARARRPPADAVRDLRAPAPCTATSARRCLTGEPITDVIRARLPSTLQLAGLAFLVAILVAIPLGVRHGRAHARRAERSVELGFTTTAGRSPPSRRSCSRSARLALRRDARALPVAGRGGLSSYVLPVAALAIAPAAALARIVRVEGLRVLDQDYMRTARGKRLPGGSYTFATRCPTRSRRR